MELNQIQMQLLRIVKMYCTNNMMKQIILFNVVYSSIELVMVYCSFDAIYYFDFHL